MISPLEDSAISARPKFHTARDSAVTSSRDAGEDDDVLKPFVPFVTEGLAGWMGGSSEWERKTQLKGKKKHLWLQSERTFCRIQNEQLKVCLNYKQECSL